MATVSHATLPYAQTYLVNLAPLTDESPVAMEITAA